MEQYELQSLIDGIKSDFEVIRKLRDSRSYISTLKKEELFKTHLKKCDSKTHIPFDEFIELSKGFITYDFNEIEKKYHTQNISSYWGNHRFGLRSVMNDYLRMYIKRTKALFNNKLEYFESEPNLIHWHEYGEFISSFAGLPNIFGLYIKDLFKDKVMNSFEKYGLYDSSIFTRNKDTLVTSNLSSITFDFFIPGYKGKIINGLNVKSNANVVRLNNVNLDPDDTYPFADFDYFCGFINSEIPQMSDESIDDFIEGLGNSANSYLNIRRADGITDSYKDIVGRKMFEDELESFEDAHKQSRIYNAARDLYYNYGIFDIDLERYDGEESNYFYFRNERFDTHPFGGDAVDQITSSVKKRLKELQN